MVAGRDGMNRKTRYREYERSVGASAGKDTRGQEYWGQEHGRAVEKSSRWLECWGTKAPKCKILRFSECGRD